ncbi:MAG: hypothetical protein CVU52_07535 [Deltaproteobacteria bacterium HGW-Deltaproteobacteria-10]|nr:MAG: hypothetical protein CVU52_07535 [Deltaproteobacteria bacterium HGW-Deltaproteobacteria-10]
MIKFKPSAEQLKGALEHIHYEIAQLTDNQAGSNNIALNNALLESRLIHVRALLDFFQKSFRSVIKEKEMDDVLCLDYGFAPQRLSIPRIYQDRLNKDLAHLTYSRSLRLSKDTPWPHDQVMLPILEHSKKFCEHLIANYLPTNYPEKLNEWQMLVSRIKVI